MVEFRHQTIATSVVTPKDRILHEITTLTDSLKDVPKSQEDSQLQAIAALRNASNSWEAPNEIPDPAVPIPRTTPTQTRRAMKIIERNMQQPAITHQKTPSLPNEPARCEPAPRQTIYQQVPAPSPRVNPKETPPAVQPIARRTRSHTQNTQPPIDLCTRSQLQQALRFTTSQEFQLYPPKVLLALWSTHITELAMPQNTANSDTIPNTKKSGKNPIAMN